MHGYKRYAHSIYGHAASCLLSMFLVLIIQLGHDLCADTYIPYTI